MKYLIVGAGGTGGSIAAFLAKAKKDVSIIARNENLQALKKGIKLTLHPEAPAEYRIKAFSSQEYAETPDVIFVCTKAYSLEEIAPFIADTADENTLIIPVLNGLRTADRLKELVPGKNIADGCIYIVGEKTAPGEYYMAGPLIKIVFGSDSVPQELLNRASCDLQNTGIKVVLTEHIKKEILQKFSLVSSMAGSGLYYNATMGVVRTDSEKRALFESLSREIVQLGEKLGISFDFDLTARNLKILDEINPDSTTSLQRDVACGNRSEFDVQITEPLLLGKSLGLPMASYQKVHDEIKIQLSDL